MHSVYIVYPLIDPPPPPRLSGLVLFCLAIVCPHLESPTRCLIYFAAPLNPVMFIAKYHTITGWFFSLRKHGWLQCCGAGAGWSRYFLARSGWEGLAPAPP